MSVRTSHLGWSLSMLAAGVAAGPVLAAESREEDDVFSMSLSTGATYSDNIGRTATDKESETSIEAGIEFKLNYDRERLKSLVAADLQYRTHDFGTYENELVGGLDGSLSYELMREHLFWIVEDNLGQSLINSQNIATPDNTQNVNYFATGPDIYLPLGTRTGINLEGRWSMVSYDESDIDSARLRGVVGIVRQIGDASSLALNGSVERVEYTDLPSSSDYDIHSAYLDWKAEGSRTSLDVQAGYTSLEYQQSTSDGPLFALEIIRKVTARSSLALNLGRSFGDSADVFRRDQNIGGVSGDTGPAPVSADPQRSDYATLSWQFEGGRSALLLSADWRKEAHERDLSQDRESIGGTLQLVRQLSPRLSLDLHADYSKEDYDTTAINFDEWGGGAGLSWTFTPAFGMSAAYDHLVGSGDTALGPGTRDYSENRISLRLTWSPGL